MAQVSGGDSGSGKSRRRSLDAEINLVPFIDLLSMCICFLLMTAVWMEIGSLQIKQLVGTSASSPTTAPFEIEVKLTSASQVDMLVKKNGKAFEKGSFAGTTMAEAVTKLQGALESLVSKMGIVPGADLKKEMNHLVSAVRITPKAGVPYGDMVTVLDGLRRFGMYNLGIVPVKE